MITVTCLLNISCRRPRSLLILIYYLKTLGLAQEDIPSSSGAKVALFPGCVGELAWQLMGVQTATSAARELAEPIRFQNVVT